MERVLLKDPPGPQQHSLPQRDGREYTEGWKRKQNWTNNRQHFREKNGMVWRNNINFFLHFDSKRSVHLRIPITCVEDVHVYTYYCIYSRVLFKQTEEIKNLAAKNRIIEQTLGNFLTALWEYHVFGFVSEISAITNDICLTLWVTWNLNARSKDENHRSTPTTDL